jgi:hypothetical protein
MNADKADQFKKLYPCSSMAEKPFLNHACRICSRQDLWRGLHGSNAIKADPAGLVSSDTDQNQSNDSR